jgi:hypothetical protein
VRSATVARKLFFYNSTAEQIPYASEHGINSAERGINLGDWELLPTAVR